MDDPADFNSSDIEISDDEAESSRIGKKAIASIVQSSVVDRIESKKKVKKLQDVANAPSTSWHRQYWFALFKQFAKHTLQIDRRPNKTPIGDDIACFLAQLPDHLQSRHDDGKTAWTVIKDAEAQLKRALTFHYEGFSLTRRDSLRLEAIIQQLLNEGKITKDPVRESLWLTCQIIERLVMVTFSDAIINGTASWDATLAGCLGLALQAALASRAGDIRRSSHYTGDQHLKWENVELIARGSAAQDPWLSMLVSLLYRKGFNNDAKNASKVELRRLDEQNNVVDITKLLVAYALRIGAVKEKTWESLISAVIRCPSKRFIWETPDMPVFFALTRGKRIDFSRQAGAEQQTRFLRRGAALAGMLQQPVSHDIRRGTAADIYSLKSSGDMEGVRRAIGHSKSSMDNGTTERYVGRVKGDTWAARIDNSATAEDDPHGVQFAPAAFKKRKIVTKDIDKYCETNGLDVNSRSARHEARQALEKTQHTLWAEHQQLVPDDDNAPSQPAVPASPEIVSLVPAPERAPLKNITNVSQPPTGTRDAAVTGALTKEISSDRALIALSTILGTDNFVASDDSPVAGVEDMVEGYTAMLAFDQATGQASVLMAPIDEFIGYLSTINRISVATPGLPLDVEAGNSRNQPSKFLFVCRTEAWIRVFDSSLRRDQHEVNCASASLDSLDEDQELFGGEGDEHALPRGRKRKPKHINVVHDGFPKPCPDSQVCGVEKTFAMKHLLTNHRHLWDQLFASRLSRQAEVLLQ